MQKSQAGVIGDSDPLKSPWYIDYSLTNTINSFPWHKNCTCHMWPNSWSTHELRTLSELDLREGMSTGHMNIPVSH